MPLIARDSIDPGSIPLEGLAAVMGYADGLYQWTPAGWARFQPPIVPLSIVVSAADQGDILDVETGDASPADCPGWADRFIRPGRRLPTIYHSRNVRDQVLAAMAGRPYDWWAATLDGTQDVPGAVAIQYLDTGAYDETVIHDPLWIGRTPMLLHDTPSFGVWLLSGSLYVHVDDPTTLQGYLDAGVARASIDDAQHQLLAAASSSAVVAATGALAQAVQALAAAAPKLGGTFTLQGTVGGSGTVG